MVETDTILVEMDQQETTIELNLAVAEADTKGTMSAQEIAMADEEIATIRPTGLNEIEKAVEALLVVPIDGSVEQLQDQEREVL